MPANVLTEAQISAIKQVPKTLTNPRAREKAQEKYIAREYRAEAEPDLKFSIYTRQNTLVDEDFSTGIIWERPGSPITLARYNGSSHVHKNKLEDEMLEFVCHIHHITERYQFDAQQPEGYATSTGVYTSLKGAFELLLKEWNISRSARNVLPASGSDLFKDQHG